jgi:hypothetical protein
MRQPDAIAKSVTTIAATSAITTKDNDHIFSLSTDGINYNFDKATGFIQKVFNGKKELSFSGGPALAGGRQTLSQFKSYKQGNAYVVEPTYSGDSLKVRWTFARGKLPRLDYSYFTRDTADYMGITFNYPEEKIKGMKYLGRGPYRVWKNRLKGQQLGVWEKAYNNTVTGESWNYPEFKGWYSEFYWAKVQTREFDFTVYTNRQNIFLQMLKPEKPKAATNNNTSPPFPEGNIGFMHAIAPIGTKFNNPAVLGRQSQKNFPQGGIPLTGTLYFDFR